MSASLETSGSVGALHTGDCLLFPMSGRTSFHSLPISPRIVARPVRYVSGKICEGDSRKDTHVFGNVVGEDLFYHVPTHSSVARVDRPQVVWIASLILFQVLIFFLVFFVILFGTPVCYLGVWNIFVLRDLLFLLGRFAPATNLLRRQDIACHGKIAAIRVFVVTDSYRSMLFSQSAPTNACQWQPRRAGDALPEAQARWVVGSRCAYLEAWSQID